MPWWILCNNILAGGIIVMMLIWLLEEPIRLARDERVYEPFFGEMLKWAFCLMILVNP